MSSIGQMFKLFLDELGPMGAILLVLLAIVAMWLGYRYSRPSDHQSSIRRLTIRRASKDRVMPRLALLMVTAIAGVACGGPYNDLEKAFPAKTDLQSKVVASRTIVLTGKRHSGAENPRGVANVGLTPAFVEISTDTAFTLFYSKVQIPTEAIAGCSKTCFGPAKWDADLLLNDVDIGIGIENSQEVLDWCWDNGLPMISGSVQRAWMYEGKALPGRTDYVRVTKDEYVSQTKSACAGY